MFHRLAFLFNRLAFPCQKMEEIIISSKKQKTKKQQHQNDLGLKLNNPRTHCKTYWTLLKTLVNDTRVPLIPSIQTGDKFITNFTEKA